MSLETRFTRSGRKLLYNGADVRLAGIYPRKSNSEGIEALDVANFGPPLQELASYRNNFFRHWMIPYWHYVKPGNAYSPYFRDGAGWNLRQYNEDYFARLDRMIVEAKSRGIVVQITVFDATGLKTLDDSRWNHHPWNQKNNAHNFILDEQRPDGGIPEFYHPQFNPKLKEAQETYARAVVSRTKAHWNVFYEIINEPYGPSQEERVGWADWMTGVIDSEVGGERMIFYCQPVGNDLRDIAADVNYWRANRATLTGYDRLDGVIFHGRPNVVDPDDTIYTFRNEKIFQVSTDAFPNPSGRDDQGFNQSTATYAFSKGMLFQAESISLSAAAGIRDAQPTKLV
jgi:Cellulase (glycosyl hydrolase family 5)